MFRGNKGGTLVEYRGGFREDLSFSWSPTLIPNKRLWLDSGDTATINPAIGPLISIADKSGSGNDFLPAAAPPSTGTRLINGRNVLDFVRTDWISNAVVSFAPPWSLWLVLRFDFLTLNWGYWLNPSGVLSGNGPAILKNPPTPGRINLNNVDCGVNLNIGITYRIAITCSAVNATSYINNAAATACNVLNFAGLTIGASGIGTEGGDGAFCELVLGSGVWDAATLANLDLYGINRWGAV